MALILNIHFNASQRLYIFELRISVFVLRCDRISIKGGKKILT